jgi:hypothetical protein
LFVQIEIRIPNAREDRGRLHIVGEVENGLSRSIDFVEVTGTFYDTNHTVIETDNTFTNPDTLEHFVLYASIHHYLLHL